MYFCPQIVNYNNNIKSFKMKKKNVLTWAVALTTVTVGLVSCGLDMPKETQSSF